MKKKTARQFLVETLSPGASATPASATMKSISSVPGSLSTARHLSYETQREHASATPAGDAMKSSALLPGSLIENARQSSLESQKDHASAASTTPAMKPKEGLSRPTKKGRQPIAETQPGDATSTPATVDLKSRTTVPGSPSTARQLSCETQNGVASAASTSDVVNSESDLSRPTKKGRRTPNETRTAAATSTPADTPMKPTLPLPGSHSTTIEAIRAHHRERRFAMGIQQVLDRKLESYIRINKTEWHVGDDETTRDKANKDVAAKIKAARKGEGDPSIVKVVRMTDDARAPADAERARHEKEMEALARSLPVAPWVETVPGLGYLGLATIIAETGDLSLYANVAKVWKRLGYAPYNGLAGSSWKRQTWRNGAPALTADEWIAHPFSGKRYSLIHVISIWLLNKQWIGAGKTEDGVGKPNGIYGEVYARRQAHTAVTHPDWSKMHSRMDALRVMMKEVLKDLWLEWNSVDRQAAGETRFAPATTETPASHAAQPSAKLPGSPINETARHKRDETLTIFASATPATAPLKTKIEMPGSPITEPARRGSHETQNGSASATPAVAPLKPAEQMPGSPIENARQSNVETQPGIASATPANNPEKSKASMPGSPIENGRRHPFETQHSYATAIPARVDLKSEVPLPGSTIE